MRDTSRRSLLASISALPAATVAAALPLPVLAHPVAPQADADLITAARRVTQWARLDQEAESRLSEAEDRRDTMQPPWPADSDPAAMSTYRMTRENARQSSGHADAERLSRWVAARLVSSADALTALPAQTWVGAVAKAQAFRTIQAAGWEHCLVDWRDNLANSIAADVLRIGTGAA